MEDSYNREMIERLMIASGSTTFVDLAGHLQVTKQTVAQARTKGVPTSWIPKVAKLFNVSTDWLFFGRGPMHPAPPEGQPSDSVAREYPPPSLLRTRQAQRMAESQEKVACSRCTQLEEELRQERAERRGLAAELGLERAEYRKLVAENQKLHQEKEALLMQLLNPKDKTGNIEKSAAEE